jgi:pimeloyl-ACP methyl ester carboxylesterase
MKIKTSEFELAAISQGDPDAKNIALILPGRLDTKDYVHMVSHVNLLSKLGFFAISFDPPGSWESSGTLEDYSTTTYVQAVNEVIDQYDRPTLLLGHSRGASVAMLASDNPNVKALVLAMATYGPAVEPSTGEIKGDYAVSFRDLPPGSEHTAKKKEFHLPLKYFEDSKIYNPSAKLETFSGPKLIICGTKDAFFSPQEVKDKFDELKPPKEFLELDTEHDYRLHPEIIDEINQSIKEFVEKYL